MKAISLWQPHASLMAIGAKVNETRGWATSYRGPLAIQAAKKWNPELARISTTGRIRRALEAAGIQLTTWKAGDGLKRGVIVCVLRLVDCVEITPTNVPQGDEAAYGDYTPGRFMWRTEGVRALKRPVPFPGAQGFFNVPDELLTEVLRGDGGAA